MIFSGKGKREEAIPYARRACRRTLFLFNGSYFHRAVTSLAGSTIDIRRYRDAILPTTAKIERQKIYKAFSVFLAYLNFLRQSNHATSPKDRLTCPLSRVCFRILCPARHGGA